MPAPWRTSSMFEGGVPGRDPVPDVAHGRVADLAPAAAPAGGMRPVGRLRPVYFKAWTLTCAHLAAAIADGPGLVVLVGPEGSGKSYTLVALATGITNRSVNIRQPEEAAIPGTAVDMVDRVDDGRLEALVAPVFMTVRVLAARPDQLQPILGACAHVRVVPVRPMSQMDVRKFVDARRSQLRRSVDAQTLRAMGKLTSFGITNPGVLDGLVDQIRNGAVAQRPARVLAEAGGTAAPSVADLHGGALHGAEPSGLVGGVALCLGPDRPGQSDASARRGARWNAAATAFASDLGGRQSRGLQSGGVQSGGLQSGGVQSGGVQSGGLQSGGVQSGGGWSWADGAGFDLFGPRPFRFGEQLGSALRSVSPGSGWVGQAVRSRRGGRHEADQSFEATSWDMLQSAPADIVQGGRSAASGRKVAVQATACLAVLLGAVGTYAVAVRPEDATVGGWAPAAVVAAGVPDGGVTLPAAAPSRPEAGGTVATADARAGGAGVGDAGPAGTGGGGTGGGGTGGGGTGGGGTGGGGTGGGGTGGGGTRGGGTREAGTELAGVAEAEPGAAAAAGPSDSPVVRAEHLEQPDHVVGPAGALAGAAPPADVDPAVRQAAAGMPLLRAAPAADPAARPAAGAKPAPAEDATHLYRLGKALLAIGQQADGQRLLEASATLGNADARALLAGKPHTRPGKGDGPSPPAKPRPVR